MSGFISIILPETGQNLVTNPSIETATTGYTAMAGAIARTAAQQRRGVYSLSCTPAAGVNDGCYYGTITLVNGSTYTMAVDVLGVLNIPYRIYFADTSANMLGSAYNFTGTGTWQRIYVTWTETTGAARRLYITKNNHASVAAFYVDGLDCKAKSYADTYTDGDQKGCSWDGTPHASTSTRDAQSRAGGQEYNLDAYSTYLLKQPGIGMPPMKNVFTPYGLLPGAFFQSSTPDARVFTLVVQPNGTSRQNLHSLRQSLIDAFKPDRVATQQPARIYYAGNTRKVFIDAIYDGGLELGDLPGFSEIIAMRFIAGDPYWTEDGADGYALTTTATLTSRNSGDALLRDTTGLWSMLGTGLNGAAYCAVYGPDGAWYVGGAFADAGGVANTAYLAKWVNGAWASVTGASAINGNVRALAFTADGTLYVAGEFTAVGAVANSGYIFKVSSAGTVTGLNVASLGANAGLWCLYIPPTGSTLASGSIVIYAAGDLSTTATSNRIAKYNGSTWSKFGSTTLNTRVYALAGSPTGSILYAGGTFSIMAGIANTQSIAKWNGSAWTALSLGLWSSTDIVYALAAAPDGTLYIAGDFINGLLGIYCMAMWNGVTISTLSTGTFNYNPGISFLTALAFDAKGRLWVIGVNQNFTNGQSTWSSSIFIWDGSSWLTGELYGNNDTFWNVAFSPSGQVMVCYTGGTAVLTPAQNAITNSGTAKAYPIFKFTGPGSVWKIVNGTTGDELYFNLNLASGEVAILDLTPTNRTFVSQYRGGIISAIAPGSALNQFTLLPGSNNLNVLTDGANPTAVTWWPRRHWSVDGST